MNSSCEQPDCVHEPRCGVIFLRITWTVQADGVRFKPKCRYRVGMPQVVDLARRHGYSENMFSSVVKIYRHERLVTDFASSEAVLRAPVATRLSAMLI